MKKLLSMLLTLSMVFSVLTAGAVFAASDTVQADLEALTVDDILSVPTWNGNTLIDNLDIDVYTKGEVNESPITWSSSNDAVISASGIVTRGTQDEEVTITATIGSGEDVATKDFTFVVPAASKSINGMPKLNTLKYNDEFSDGVINTSKFTTSLPTAEDSAVEENGKMTLNRNAWTSGEPYIELSYEYNGNLATTIEFTLESTMSYVRIPFIGYNWNGYPIYIHWYPMNNNISIGKGGIQTDSMELGRIPLPASAKGGKAKFTVNVDAKAKTYSIWVNNEIVISKNAYMESSAQKPYKIRFTTVTTSWMYGVGSISVDNVKIYESTASDALSALLAAEKNLGTAATYTSVNTRYLTGEFVDVSAISTSNGSVVNYDVSDTSVLSETGKVTRALTDKSVAITATITSADGGQLVKTYKYTIPGKYNKIGKNGMPLIDMDYPVAYTSTANQAGVTDSSILTAYSEENGKVSFTSAYASNKEPGFTYKYSDNLKNNFVQDFAFSSNSNAMRARVSDSAYNRKLDIYYLDNKTLAVSGASTVNHEGVFTGKTINLSLVYSMSANTVDIYLNGELWLDDFALVSGGHANIQHVLVSHHCATIMGAWRGGQGTTTFYSLNAYKVVDESTISSVMASDIAYSNEGVVATGENTATVALVAGNESGEKACKIVYAIYSVENNVKKLVGIDIVSATLDEYTHKEYTAKIKLADAPANAQQALFIWTADGLVPVETEAFPAQ